MMERERLCVAVVAAIVAIGFAVGRAEAQPIVVAPGVIDDRVVEAAQICSRRALELRNVTIEIGDKNPGESRPVARPDAIENWCRTGDLANLSANAENLLAAISICGEPGEAQNLANSDKERIKKICAEGAPLSRDDARRLHATVRETREKQMRLNASPLASGPTEAAAGAVATTTDIVARAVASFLEKRAKAEFKEFILRRLRRKVCDDLKLLVWLPSTCAYLGSDEDDATLPLSLGTGLRSVLLLDTAQLPHHVITNLLTPTKDAPGDADMLLTRVGFETALALVQHRDPSYIAKVLDDLVKNPSFCREDDADCGEVKVLLATVARALVLSRTEQIRTAQALDFTFTAQVLVAGMAEDLKRCPPGNVVKRQILVDDHALNFDDGKPIVLLTATRALADATQRLATLIEKPIDDKLGGEKAHFREVAIQAAAVINQFDAVVAATSDLIANPEVKAKVTELHQKLTFASSLVTALVQADLSKTVTLVLTQLASDPKRQATVPGAVARVLSFAVDLATSKDSKEAEAVIESVAAPVGAWQGKREDTVFSISGFVGGALGRESTRSGGTDVRSKSFGPIAALGLDINAPGKVSWVFRDYVRPGLFLSVVDVGALMTYSYDTPRKTTADNGSAQAGPTTPIGFAQVFSPGAFLRLGIWNTPLVVGGGMSFLPRGRSITMTDASMTATNEERSAWRWSVFVAVDVTVLPF